MKRLLLAGLATGALIFAAPALAQNVPPVPANPPIEQPEPAPEAAPDAQAEALPAAPPAGELAEAPEAEAADAPDAPPQPELAETPTPDAQVAATPEASPADAAPPAAQAASTAQAVCQPRVTSVHFGQNGSALTLQNRNAIEYAVDAASVCNLEQVTIAASAEGRAADRRAETVRATLVERGVPEERIVVAEEATGEGASTGQLDVRMTFAGVATAETPLASLEGAPEPTGR
ncbi:MAG TPA: hypothetical protein PLK37_01080 [Terricaulis sp.]|nr:hypothetical protein [Terricaulis sp.]